MFIDVRSFFENEGYIDPQIKHQSGIPVDIFQHLDLLLRMEFVKHHPTSLDIIEALEVTKHCFEETRRCVGTVMYQRIDTRQPIGEDFVFIRDVKSGIEMYCRMITERHQTKYKNVLKHVIHPLLETFRYMSHEEALECYEARFDALIDHIKHSPYQYDDIDAKVAYRVLVKSVKSKTAARDAAEFIHNKRTKVKK